MYYSIISSFLSLSEQRLSTSSTTSVLRFPKKPSIVVISFFARLVHGNAGSGGAGEDPRPGPRRMVRSVMDGFVSSEVDIRLLWYRLSSYCAVLYLTIDAQALSSGLPFFLFPFQTEAPLITVQTIAKASSPRGKEGTVVGLLCPVCITVLLQSTQ